MTAQTAERTNKLTKDLTVGKPSKNILLFVLPIILGQFFQLLYNWTDAIIVGQYYGGYAFGAISACAPVINLFITLTMGFMTGAAVITGQLFAGKDLENLKKAQTTIMICMIATSLILMTAGTLLTEPLLRLMNVPSEQFEYSAAYLKIYFLGIAGMTFYNAFAQILQSLGNSKTPLLVLMCSTMLSIGLDFIFVPKTGVVGAAVSTVVAQALAAIFLFVYIQMKLPELRIAKQQFVFDKSVFRSILRLAVPSMIQQFCASLGFLAINALVNKNGPDYLTAFGLGNRIHDMMLIQVMSFGTALTAFSAQNKGAGKPDRIKKGLSSGLLMCGAIIAVLGILLLIFRESVVGLFMSTDPTLAGNPDEISRITSQFMLIMVPSFFFLEVMFLLSCVMRGAGAAVAAMEINVVSLIVRVAAAFTLDSIFGVVGVFVATPIAWGIGMLWAMRHYFRKKWNNVPPQAVAKA